MNRHRKARMTIRCCGGTREDLMWEIVVDARRRCLNRSAARRHGTGSRPRATRASAGRRRRSAPRAASGSAGGNGVLDFKPVIGTGQSFTMTDARCEENPRLPRVTTIGGRRGPGCWRELRLALAMLRLYHSLQRRKRRAGSRAPPGGLPRRMGRRSGSEALNEPAGTGLELSSRAPRRLSFRSLPVPVPCVVSFSCSPSLCPA